MTYYAAASARTFYGTLELSSGTDEFSVWSSPYSGAFSLLNSMYIPKPCGYISLNMTQMDYFYGQWEELYNMKLSAGANQYLLQMGGNYKLLFQNGSESTQLMRLVYDNATLFVQTNDENLVGTQVTYIRGCDSLNRLIDLNLYINISDNTAPDFATTVQTEFNMWINETINYKLPQLTPNYIDESEVYVNSMENQNFPSFIYFNN